MKPSTTLAALVAHCRKLTRRQQLPDAELLRRLADQRDHVAFEELLERYASLVWGVCRRIVANESDCEDAFQAVFLALFRQASAVDGERPLGAWLHGVSVHAALKAAAHSARYPAIATMPERTTEGDIADELGNRELFRVVDEEIARLPALLRDPFVLCCLEGRTRDEAATMLRCSVAAVKSRLERSRNHLRKKLERRGIGLPAAFLVLGLTGEHIRASLRAKAFHCAIGFTPPAIAALVPAAGASLTSKVTLTAISLVVVSALGFGAFHVMQAGPLPDAPASAKASAPQAPAAEKPQPRLDRFGDPLPEGAIRRFGTQRFRHVEIADLAFTPDSKRLIAGSGHHPLSVFDAVTGRCLREVGKASIYSNAHGFALAPDGKRVACCGSDVFVWDLETGGLVRELKCGRCQSVAFSPDGKKIAAVKEDATTIVIVVVEVATGKHLSEWAVEQGKPQQFTFDSLAFSPDGKFLAGTLSKWRVKETGPNSRSVQLVSSQVHVLVAATCKRVRAFDAAVAFYHVFAFQPGTGRLAVAGTDGILRFWDVDTGKELHRLPARKGVSYVPRFTADGRRCLALNGKAGYLSVLDTQDGRELRRLKLGAGIWPAVIALSPDGRAVAAATYFTGVRVHVWDIESGVERLADAGHDWAPNLSLSADGRTLISQSEKVFHWDLRTGEGRPQPVAVKKEAERISWAFGKVTARGRNWRLTIDEEKIEVRSLDGSRLLRQMNIPTRGLGFALSPDGTYAAIAVEDARNTVFLWNPEKEEKPRSLAGHLGACHELLFSHDGKRLIAGMWVWEVATARPVHKLAANSAPCYMFLTADDRVLLTGEQRDAVVHAWDMETGKELARLADPSLKNTNQVKSDGAPGIAGFALSADERFLAILARSGNTSAVSVWETCSWKLVRAFAPVSHRYYDNSIRYFRSLIFSRDGRSLFAAYSDSTILQWDVSGRFGQTTEKPNEDRLNVLWRTLTQTPEKAYPAVWEMLDHPAESTPFLIGKLAPAKPVDEKRVRQLLAQLDSESFVQREEANRQLLALGEQILPLLRQALKKGPSLEVKKRIEGLIESLILSINPDQLRLLRALAVLEWSNRAEVVEHLRRLAGGAPSALLTQAAKAAWQRVRE